MLWQLLAILAQCQGKIRSDAGKFSFFSSFMNPNSIPFQRPSTYALLRPALEHTGTNDPNSPESQILHLLRSGGSTQSSPLNPSCPAPKNLEPAVVMEFQNFLLEGKVEGAVDFALNNGMYTHALLAAMVRGTGSDIYKRSEDRG